MTPQSMYKSVLLPEILECLQAFFPSLVEQSYEHCKGATNISLREVRSANTHLRNRFQRVLTPPVTRPRALPSKANFAHLEHDTARLCHLWSIVTQEEIARRDNPLAPEQLLAAIESSLQLSCLSDTDILVDEIEKQLELIGENLYQQINSILAPCANEASSSVFTTNDLHVSHTPTEQPTLSDAEQAIEQVKHFFDDEITDQKIGTRFHALCKKMYIPAINCALMSPASEGKPAIVELLKKVQLVGQFWFEQRPHDAVLIARAENTVRRFIKAAMQGHTDLSPTLKAVEQIIIEYHIDEQPLPLKAQEMPAPITTLDEPQLEISVDSLANEEPDTTASNIADTQFDTSEQPQAQVIDHEPASSSSSEGAAASIIANKNDNAPVITLEDKPKAPVKAPSKPSLPSIYKQAKHLIEMLLSDCSPGSLAHQLRKEWLRVLEAVGSRQGINSKAWGQSVDIFLMLTEYTNTEDMPISLAYKAQAQLKFASIDNHFFDTKTQSLKIKTPAGGVISEGHWFDYMHNGKATRCKLVAIIRQIGRFIFVSRQGQKVLEVEKGLLETMLQEGSLRALGEVSVNSTIEDVLSNIKHVQAKEFT